MKGILAAALLLAQGSWQPVQAQFFKRYWEAGRGPAVEIFSAKTLSISGDQSELIMAGEWLDQREMQAVRGFVMRTSLQGEAGWVHTFYTNSVSGVNGLKINTLCSDSDGSALIGGSSFQSWAPGSGAERFIAKVNVDGSLAWARMQSENEVNAIAPDVRPGQFAVLSGPDGHLAPLRSLLAYRITTEGDWIDGMSLITGADDQPGQIFAQADGSYRVTGNHDTAGVPGPMLIGLDEELMPRWGWVYRSPGETWTLRASAVRERTAALTGTLRGAEEHGFLILTHAEGEARIARTYTLATGAHIELRAVAATEDGWLLAGSSYDPQQPSQRRSIVIQTDADGEPIAAVSYFEPSLTDYDLAETATSLQYAEEQGIILVGGELVKSIGGQTDRRLIWAVQDLIPVRNLEEGSGACGTMVQVRSERRYVESHDLNITPQPGGGLNGFGLLEGQERFTDFRCSGHLQFPDAAQQDLNRSTPLDPAAAAVPVQVRCLDAQGRIIGEWPWQTGMQAASLMPRTAPAGVYVWIWLSRDGSVLRREKTVHASSR
ncbi:MAG: hypothetical protein NW241_23700 [Bacteroidia bacterium]|nr:hypothetical protein [Bacteroidia bacterium]